MAYTVHGHHIPGTPSEDAPNQRVECGGCGNCSVCDLDATWELRPDKDKLPSIKRDKKEK